MGNIILKYSSKEELIDFILDIEEPVFENIFDEEEYYKENLKEFNKMKLHEIEEYAEKKGYIELTEKQKRLI